MFDICRRSGRGIVVGIVGLEVHGEEGEAMAEVGPDFQGTGLRGGDFGIADTHFGRMEWQFGGEMFEEVSLAAVVSQ